MRYSKHAMVRMRERNMTHQDINTCLAYGKCLVNKHDSTKNTWILNGTTDIYVVTNKANTVVITVWPK